MKTVLLDRLASGDLEDVLSRFRREGKAAARLGHPTIAAVHDADEHDGQPFLVFELVEGQDLAAVLAGRRSGLPVDRVLGVGAQVADGLAAAHGKGVIHRDVKPSNVMLLGDGRVKICDFGIARVAGATTSPGSVIGTLAYMAPEQLRGDLVTGAADVYALGATLFHLLTRRLPFPAEDPRAVYAAHQAMPPPDPVTLRPDCPAVFGRYLLTMLAKEPGQRPDAAAVAAALRAMQHHPAAPPDKPHLRPPQARSGPGNAGSGASRDSARPTTLREGDILSPRVLKSGETGVTAVAFSPDGRTLASGELGGIRIGSSGAVRIWDVATGRQLACHQQTSPNYAIHDLAYNRAGTILASADAEFSGVRSISRPSLVLLRDASSARVIVRLAETNANQIAFSPDGTLFAAAGFGSFGIWDVAARCLAVPENCSGNSVAFSPDGGTLAVGFSEGVGVERRIGVELWDVDYHRKSLGLRRAILDLKPYVPSEAVTHRVAFSPDGTMLAVAVSRQRDIVAYHSDGGIFLWDPVTGRLAGKLDHSGGAQSVAFSPDGNAAAGCVYQSSDSAGMRSSVMLWNVFTCRSITIPDSSGEGVSSVAFSPDGTLLAAGGTGGADGGIRLWSLSEGQRLKAPD